MKNKYFILDKNIDKKLIDYFSKIGHIIFTKEINNLYFPVNSHPDIQIHFLNNKTAVCCPEVFDYYRQNLPNYIKLLCGKNRIEGGYPQDASYNAVAVGRNFVSNTKYIDKTILNYYLSNNYNIIDVKQGYTKCNICIVNSNAVITEDLGIAKELEKNNIDVCLIEVGDILLNNFKYGFIGGATVQLDKDIIFLGDIKKHKQFYLIEKFLSKHNKNLICARSELTEDFGSVIYFED